jgi:two-component sensor histidine kinase
MQRIEQEDSPRVVEMSLAQKLLSMASLLAICIALGVLIGNSSEYRTLSRGKGKQRIEQFRDTYHLYTIRKSEIRQIPCY